MYRDIPVEFKDLIEPVVKEHGLELIDIEKVGGKNAPQLRIIVDTPALDGRVDVERCAQVSREVGTLLEASGIIERAYRLEVSSPGLNRKLSREKDFGAACGRRVEVETKSPIEARRHFDGMLKEFAEGKVFLALDEQEVVIPFDEVRKAHVVYEFSRADFTGPERTRVAGETATKPAGKKRKRGTGKKC